MEFLNPKRFTKLVTEQLWPDKEFGHVLVNVRSVKTQMIYTSTSLIFASNLLLSNRYTMNIFSLIYILNLSLFSPFIINPDLPLNGQFVKIKLKGSSCSFLYLCPEQVSIFLLMIGRFVIDRFTNCWPFVKNVPACILNSFLN